MRYIWSKERDIHVWRANKPTEGLPLSGVVLVKDRGVGYSYIRIGSRALRVLGRVMPYGIGGQNLAYLQVIRKKYRYDVFCSYLDKSKSVALWCSSEIPEWVGKVRYNGET